MGALADAVGIAVVDEAALEDGLADRMPGMVNHSVPEGGRGDHAVFGVEDLELPVAPGAVGTAL